MPRGPKGERRPADVIGNAVKVMRITTGEGPEDYGRDTTGAAGDLHKCLSSRAGVPAMQFIEGVAISGLGLPR
jgi:hypothetical protein